VTETQGTTEVAAPVFPPGRYGRRRSGRRRRWLTVLGAASLAVVMLLVSIRLYRTYGDPTYDPQVIGYTDIADDQILIKFQVAVPAGGSATCLLRARDYDGYTVGHEEIRVHAAPGERNVVAEHRLATSSRPFIGEVLRCRQPN
jgi:hypothetical protein